MEKVQRRGKPAVSVYVVVEEDLYRRLLRVAAADFDTLSHQVRSASAEYIPKAEHRLGLGRGGGSGEPAAEAGQGRGPAVPLRAGPREHLEAA